MPRSVPLTIRRSAEHMSTVRALAELYHGAPERMVASWAEYQIERLAAGFPPGDGTERDDLDDGVVRLREWADDDAAWYAECVRDPEIQRFTTESPTLRA